MQKLKKRNKIYGLGVNDADYIVKSKSILGGYDVCPYYRVWENMMARVHKASKHGYSSKYDEVEIDEEWLSFMNFRQWMKSQNWENKQLDKDLMGNGKLYSAKSCVFLSPELNKALVVRNGYKQTMGVSWDTERGRWMMAISRHGKKLNKRFDDKSEAMFEYCKLRIRYIMSFMHSSTPEINSKLLDYIRPLKNYEWTYRQMLKIHRETPNEG